MPGDYYPTLADFSHSLTRIIRHMSIPSPEAITKIADWRQKAREGTLTRDEMREAITFLRAERQAIPASTPKPRSTKAQAAAINADDLLGELGI